LIRGRHRRPTTDRERQELLRRACRQGGRGSTTVRQRRANAKIPRPKMTTTRPRSPLLSGGTEDGRRRRHRRWSLKIENRWPVKAEISCSLSRRFPTRRVCALKAN